MKLSIVLLETVLTLHLLLYAECAEHKPHLYSSRRRILTQRGGSRSRFRLLSQARQNIPGRRRIQYGGTFSSASSRRMRGNVKQVAALKSGKEGSYDYSKELNAIWPDKSAYVKPTKAPMVLTTVANPHKINVESGITAQTEVVKSGEKAAVGGVAIIHCFFDSQAQTGKFKHSQIWWTKQPSRATDRPVILGAGTQVRLPDHRLKLINFDESYSILVIRDVIKSDEGSYKCSLPTVSGTYTQFATLRVYDTAAEKVATSPAQNSVRMGGNITLFCSPEDRTLNVWWTAKRKSGETIDLGNGKRKILGRELSLKNVNKMQSGIYTCHTQVAVGSPIQHNFSIIVKEKPWHIAAFRGGFNVDTFLSKFRPDPKYGDEVNLRCDSGGTPTPTVTWFKGDQQLSDAAKYEVKSQESAYTQSAVVGRVTIRDFTPGDEGRYHCRVSNDMGSRQREFTVKGHYSASMERLRSSRIDDDEDVQPSESTSKPTFGNEIKREGSGDVPVEFPA